MAEVILKNLVKAYDEGGPRAVNDMSLEIADGEFLVLVGPSGCGKSTALKIIAGLEEPTSGEVLIGSENVNDYAPRDRDIAMVFQSYALYPHMSVFDNIAFPLQIAGLPKTEIKEKVSEVARILQLEEYLARKPGKLSGGQRQRVAMGRAIIRQPSVFLMDEPLSNLDAKLRVQMRTEIAQIQRRLGVTTIYVTHDQVEAMTMGDRVVLMRDGVLQQVDSPKNIYDNPSNTFVASFIGSPSMNLFRSQIEKNGGNIQLRIGEQTLPIPESSLAPNLHHHAERDNELIIGIRPENIEDATLVPQQSKNQILKAPVVLTESLGSDHMVHFTLDAPPAKIVDQDMIEEVVVHDNETTVCIGRFDARSTVRAGEEIEVAISSEHLHFFDAQTGEAI
jgi:multiple sugar transport system ATP-binding protein